MKPSRLRPSMLLDAHSPSAVRERLSSPPPQSYLRDLVYGAIDGIVTTFAVVAGSAGAGFRPAIAIVLGFANLLADGFSMAVSNFSASRAERQEHAQARQEEQRQIREFPEGEREEIRQIFAAKGFEGEDLERVVSKITSDIHLWVDTMMVEELGFGRELRDPLRAALTTFGAFLVAGFVPLIVFVYQAVTGTTFSEPFLMSAIATGVAFFSVGAMKSRFVDQSWWRAGLETFALGGAAASLAFIVGSLLQTVAG